MVDLLENDRVLVPAGSVLRGVVSSVNKAGRINRKGSLTVVFDRITIRGRAYPTRGTVEQALESEGIKGEAGKIGSGLGFNTYLLRTTAGMDVAPAEVKKAGGSYQLVSTQDHHIIDEQGFHGREKRIGEKHESGIILHEASFEQYKKNPRSVHPPREGN